MRQPFRGPARRPGWWCSTCTRRGTARSSCPRLAPWSPATCARTSRYRCWTWRLPTRWAITWPAWTGWARCPGRGHLGDAAELRRRIDADRRYLDALERGAPPVDPRLAQDWLRAEHDA